MGFIDRLSVSRTLLILAGALIALFGAVTLSQLQRMRTAQIVDSERQLTRLDMVFAEQTGRAVESVDLVLRSASDTLQALQARPPVDPALLSDLIRRRIEGVRQLRGVVLADADGGIAYASLGQPSGALADALKAEMRYDTAHPQAGLRISEPFHDGDGSWTALLARPVTGPDGRFDGTAAALLNLQYFEDFYKAVELSEGGAITLHRRDGTVLARYPHDEQAIGTSYADLPPFKDILTHAMAGTVEMDSPLDGTRRVLAIRALKAFPLAVNVSLDEGSVLAGWRSEAALLGGAMLAAGLVVAGLLLLVARRSRQVERLVGEFRGARDLAERTNQRLVEQMAEREQAEAALRQAQRIEAVGQLTGGVAHDFNNLLTVVIGNVDLLLREGGLASTAEQRLATVRAAADRGATLTAHLLAFSRRQPLVPQSADINGLVDGMRPLLESALRGIVRIETSLDPMLWPAMVDATQVEQTVLNLAINARDAMPDGGRLLIATRNVKLGPPVRPDDPPAGDFVEIEVADEGCGMTPQVLAKAVEPFFTTKPVGAGSGLGLSQVYGLTRQSGGSVSIDSAPGAGTRVHVRLPRAPYAPAAAARAPTTGAAAPRRAFVLLVDDDEAVRETTGMLLENAGYELAQADCGAAALRALAEQPRIDLLLTDLAMPGMTGAELARHAARMRPGLPVVFISGYAEPEQLAGDSGMHRLVRKPFRASALLAEIEAALGTAALALT